MILSIMINKHFQPPLPEMDSNHDLYGPGLYEIKKIRKATTTADVGWDHEKINSNPQLKKAYDAYIQNRIKEMNPE